jgi:broad specificity phosphatase PhoE
MRVVLVRHGPSAHFQTSGSIDRSAVLKWRDAYDAAGIRTISQPPPALIQTAADATHIVASDLPRAIASAQRLAPRREIRVSPLFRETPIPVPHWPTRLPLSIWEMLIHAAWNYRILRGIDVTPTDRAQAAQAAEWLSGLIADGSTALIVTHGVFRRLLAKQLVSLGWRSSARRGGYNHWSSWTFARQG